MKPVFKCDYCSKIGTEEEIREHEPKCKNNYDMKSCDTCIHKTITYKNSQVCYECKVGYEIPAGCLIKFCDKYERNENANNTLNDLFGGFGNIFSK